MTAASADGRLGLRRAEARLVLLASLMFASIQPASAASEVAELRRQLEQLQRRLAILEARRPTAAPAGRRAAAAAPPDAPPRADAAAEAPPMVVSGRAAVSAGVTQAVTRGSEPGSLRIPGTDTSVRLYGWVTALATRDFGARNRSDTISAQSIPLNPGSAARLGGDTAFTARRTRLGFETVTDTAWGAFRTVVEMDFAGAQSTASLQSQATTTAYIPRLRLAYGALGPVLAGQNYSLFYDENLPQRLDRTAPLATSSVRQAQLRYTHDFGGGWTVAGSVESPYNDVTTTNGVRYEDLDTGTAAPSTRNQWPDLLLRLQYQENDTGAVGLTGLLRPALTVTNRGDARPADRYSGTTTGWGLQLSGMLHVGERDRAYLRVVYGHGIGRYLNTTANGQAAVSDAELPGFSGASRRVDAVPVFAVYGGYTHHWTETLRTNVSAAWATLSYPGYAREFSASGRSALNRSLFQGGINLVWSPVPRVDFGIEYLVTTRTLLAALPEGAGTEGARHGRSHRLVTGAFFRF